MATLSKNLRKLRGDRTQTDIAYISGVTMQTIWRIENEAVEARKGTIEKLAKALGVSVKRLLGSTKPTWGGK